MLLPSLLNAQVGINAGIACCACEVLILSVGNVLSVLGKVLFGQSEVSKSDMACFINQNVLRF